MEFLSESLKAEAAEIDKEVIAEVENLAQLSRSKINKVFNAYSNKAFAKFLGLPLEKKEKMRDQALVMQRILRADMQPEEIKPEVHEEWYLIERAFKFYGLQLKDDFQKYLQKDDVIEIYSAEHIQIFRTFNFYKYSAYSYLDLLVNEWYHLWERPSHVLNALYAVGVSVVAGEKSGLISMDHIPEHVYKEIYNSSDLANFESRSVQCKFGHIAPLYGEGGQIAGFIINCRVKVLGLGDETKKLSFI